MAHPFIAVRKCKGFEYASICTPARVNGKKVNNPIYLGRVINLKEGLFRSRSKGEFFYSLENGFSYPDKNTDDNINQAIARGSLNLGHVYCTHSLLKRTGLLNLFKEIDINSSDTLLALIMHRLLNCYADSHAHSFYEQTYTSILYPKANLTSQNISRYLAKIGSDGIRIDFHNKYIDMIYPKSKPIGILIDSTGLTNDIDISITAFSNHGGNAEKQIRLIYVVDRETLNPIYYRALPGNIVDIVTLKGTIAELKSMNVNIGYSVLDACYNSESNIEELFSLGIDFMTRLISNRTLYKDLLANNCDTIMHPSNRLVYNKRLMFMTMNKIKINNHNAYAYIGVDTVKKFDGIKNIGIREDPKEPLSDEEFDKKTKMAGMFVMISSIEMDRTEVLPYYYSRQTIEQIFDTGKNYARLLPLGVHSQETLNGHLLLSFITTIVFLRLQKIFHKQKYNTLDFITELKGITCGVYNDHLHVYEPTVTQKAILKILEMEIPTRLPLNT